MGLPAGVTGVLLDVEGTTTPIAFVYETLFPFARRRLGDACRRGAGNERDWSGALALLRREHAEDPEDPPEFGDGSAYASWLMARDRKSTGLKALQGLIWEEGYRTGELRSVVFDDVPVALAAWAATGVRIRIFSSGSVLAQRLLFSHTDHGDLTRWIEGYHDTTTGPKREAASYGKIAEAFGSDPARILYASDVVEELDAARCSGLATALLRRPGNHPVPPHDHPRYEDFTPLTPDPV